MRCYSILLAMVLLAASCGGGTPDVPQSPSPEQTTLQRACAWLWNQQAADGGWHSDTYGLMRSGQSLTPFVLHALITVPEAEAERPAGGVSRALDFIRKHTNDEGCLGRSDPDIADYPVHATAYAVRCLVAAGNEADRELIRRMCNYLLTQQFNDARGFTSESLRWGGWGFGSDGSVMDVGHTRHALKALRDAYRETLIHGAQKLIVISGEPGIGKRSLVNALLDHIPANEASVMRATARAATRYTPFGVVADFGRDAMGLAEGAEPKEIQNRIEMLGELLWPNRAASEEVRELVDAACLLFGIRRQGSRDLDPNELRARLHKIALRLCTGSSAHRRRRKRALGRRAEPGAQHRSHAVQQHPRHPRAHHFAPGAEHHQAGAGCQCRCHASG